MNKVQQYDRLLNDAKAMYASGHDNTYIELQFAEQNIDDVTIGRIIADINQLKKKYRKNQGLKEVVLGLSFIGVAILIAFISSHSGSPVIFLLCGTAISGVFILIKGIFNLLNF